MPPFVYSLQGPVSIMEFLGLIPVSVAAFFAIVIIVMLAYRIGRFALTGTWKGDE